MVCYQVIAQYAFVRHKSALVSIHIRVLQNGPAYLVEHRLPVGDGLKVSNFFETEKEAAAFVSHVRVVYKNRIASNPALPGGQLTLF